MARLVLGQRDAEPSPALIRLARDGRLAGLLWFRSAFSCGVEETAARIAGFRTLWPAGAPCIFAADEEGGLIQQLSGLVEAGGRTWTRLPSMRTLGRGGNANVAFAHGRETGRRLRRVGIDVALAPVVDLDPGPESGVLGTRCLSDDPERVTRMAVAWLRGLVSTGVRGCLKHYPGHGATRIDSHLSLPIIDPDVDSRRHERPFLEMARQWRDSDGPPPGLMTAHIVIAPDDDPVTLDPDRLRRRPSRLTPVWTDALEMRALERYGDLEARALRAVAAGVDLLIVGEEIDGGLDLAARLSPSEGPIPTWSTSALPPAIPEPWPFEEIVDAAGAGLRLLVDKPIPAGPWDWILPVDFDPYGPVATPESPDTGVRTMTRVLRYRRESPPSLRACLADDPERPALVGWLHRGLPDRETEEMLAAAGPRLAGLVHLLDGPPKPVFPSVWTIETCGFGEGELAALARRWSNVAAA